MSEVKRYQEAMARGDDRACLAIEEKHGVAGYPPEIVSIVLVAADAYAERDTLAAENQRLQVQVNALRQHKTDYMEAAEGTRKALEAELAALKGEQVAVGHVYTMQPCFPGEPMRAHAQLHVALPAGTKLYTHPAPQQPGQDVADTARLEFMLRKHRQVVVERLTHDNFEVYVEEGVMGDYQYPGVRYSGEWDNSSPEAAEIKREAIDAALSANDKQSGGEAQPGLECPHLHTYTPLGRPSICEDCGEEL